EQIDRGLVLSALAAMKRGSAPAPRAQQIEEREQYERLVTTIRSPDEIHGRALAERRLPRGWRVAGGDRVWTCKEPLGETPCGPWRGESSQPVIVSCAFNSDRELSLVGYSGDVTVRNLDNGAERRTRTEATS